MDMDFAMVLREYRKRMGWTQEELSQQLSYSFETISAWERRKRKPGRPEIPRLALLLEREPAELARLIATSQLQHTTKAMELRLYTEEEREKDLEPSSDVLQLEQKEHSLEQDGVTRSNDTAVFWLSESAIFIPASLQSVILLKGSAPWFVLKQGQWEDLVRFYEKHTLLCGELQEHLNEEFRCMDAQSQDQEYAISRRQALGTLVALPLALLIKAQTKRIPLIPEEFLPRCTASIESCWDLLNTNGLSIIKELLPTYLPTLVALAKQPSPYQHVAASLGTQGSLLMWFVSYHQLRFQDALSYATQATELAYLTEEDNLRAFALLFVGFAYHYLGQKRMMLEKHQEAQLHLETVVPTLQSYILAQLARAYAQNGHIQEALRSIGEARARFPEHIEKVPSFVSADYGLFQLVTFEGLTHLSLGEQTTGNDAMNYHTQANTMFSQIESLSTEMILPERTRVEITNQRALAAMRMGDLEQFEQYFIQGVQGANALGSQKRKDEAKANWREARQRWPHEKKILEFADLLIDTF